jgi:hypothetical protein
MVFCSDGICLKRDIEERARIPRWNAGEVRLPIESKCLQGKNGIFLPKNVKSDLSYLNLKMNNLKNLNNLV